MPPLAVLFLVSFLLISARSHEVQVSGQFSVGEGEAAEEGPAQESPLFNLPSMRIAREYLRRQAEKERLESFKKS